MSDQHAKSPHWDHCSTCTYPWPCREALLVQIAALRDGLATIVQAFTSGIYCANCGASLDTEGCDCVISVARALLAPPAAP
jgi:hypothetical protein